VKNRVTTDYSEPVFWGLRLEKNRFNWGCVLGTKAWEKQV